MDKLSSDPVKQRFEKAVSGIYLGKPFKAVYPEVRTLLEKMNLGNSRVEMVRIENAN